MRPEDYYRRNAKLGNVDGAWKKHVKKNKDAELLENSKILENNINKPKVQPKVRQETMLERIASVQYMYGDSKVKPAHYDNPNIVSAENWKKKPEKWDGHQNFSKDQKQQMSSWDEHLNIAKKPKSPEERREALDTKRMLMQTYNNPKLKNTLAEDELKLINKHKSQLTPKVTPVVTPGLPLRKAFRPSPPVDVNQFINQKNSFKPGLTEDFMALNKEINKNVKYVLGEDQKEESTNEKYHDNNKEETHDR